MGTASSPSAPSGPAGARPRPLWQVPVFLIGVAALTGAWFLHDPAESGARQPDRQLSRARQMLNRSDGDAEAAAEVARQAVELAGSDGDRAGEAYFYLGTANMRLADHTPG